MPSESERICREPPSNASMTMRNRYQRVPSSGVRVPSSQNGAYPKTVRLVYFSQRGRVRRWFKERSVRDEPHPDDALHGLQLAVSVLVGRVQSKIQAGEHLLSDRLHSPVHSVDQSYERPA